MRATIKAVIILLFSGLSGLLFQNCAPVNVVDAPVIPVQKTVSLTINDCLPAGSSLNSAFAINRSAHLIADKWVKDTDRDGLPDQYESVDANKIFYLIGVNTSDTNADGYSDLSVVKAGQQIEAQKSLRVCADGSADTDLDGLGNCDEQSLKLDELKFDTDGDGIPDLQEILFKLNPNDMHDAKLDSDFDGLSNLKEVQMGTDLFMSNSPRMNEISLQYKVNATGEPEDNCFAVEVSSIPVMDVNNGNKVVMTLTEKTDAGVDSARNVTIIVPASLKENRRVIVNGAKNQIIKADEIELYIEAQP